MAEEAGSRGSREGGGGQVEVTTARKMQQSQSPGRRGNERGAKSWLTTGKRRLQPDWPQVGPHPPSTPGNLGSPPSRHLRVSLLLLTFPSQLLVLPPRGFSWIPLPEDTLQLTLASPFGSAFLFPSAILGSNSPRPPHPGASRGSAHGAPSPGGIPEGSW